MIQKFLKYFYDDFLNLNNWSNSGGWIVENSILKSQQDFLYNHEVNNIITSNQGLAFVGGVNYVMTLDTRYELEWDNDYVSIYRNCEECSNNELFHLSNTDYEWQQLYSPFNSVQGPITYDSFSINFITDHSLNYRGFELNNLSILAKPMYAYCYTSDLNQDAIIDILVSEGMTEEDAYDHFYYNVDGSYMGEFTPIYINTV